MTTEQLTKRIRRLNRTLVAIVVLGALALGIVSGLVHIDHYAGTYGVSVGTDTHSCSVETTGVSCEVAR